MGSPDDELLQVMSHASWFLNDGV